MNRVRIALFERASLAEPAREQLRKAGIEADIHAESTLARLWFVSRWNAGARLEVPARQAQRANQLLQHWASDGPYVKEAIRCPDCGALSVDFPQFTEKSLFTNLFMGLLAELGFIQREYYCERCHCMWPKANTRPGRQRAHLAPDYFLEHTPPASQPEHAKPRPPRQFRRPSPIARAFRLRPACRPVRGARLRFHVFTPWAAALEAALLFSLSTALAAFPSDAHKFAVRPEHSSGPNPQSPTYLRDVLPIFMGKCARCHNEQTTLLANWLDYHTARARRWEIKRRVWDSWQGSYFKQPMPAANGPEALAITEEERQVIKEWVESGAPRGVPPVYSGGLSRSQKVELGKRLFSTICAACHQPTGQGIPGRFPPLAGSDFLNADKHRAIKLVVNGLQGEVVVNGQHFNNAMPKFPLTDQDIACALTFVYSSFGNSGKEVTPQEVKAVRSETAEAPSTPPTTAKIPEEKSPYE